MNWNRNLLCQQIVTGAIALTLISSMSYSAVRAQTTKLVSVIRFVPPPVLTDRGATSGRQRGTASRGRCKAFDQPLTALVPATKEAAGIQKDNPALDTYESVFAKSTSEAPILWFYNPYVMSTKLPIEFVLEDEQGNLVYRTTFATAQTQPGIISFGFPPKAAALKVGKNYHWYFSINCDDDAPALVHGWIQRVVLDPDQKSQVQKATAQQRVAFYARNGIWHDALTTLAELRSANPGDAALANDWINLLHEVGLDAIAKEPVVPCCTAHKVETQRRTW